MAHSRYSYDRRTAGLPGYDRWKTYDEDAERAAQEPDPTWDERRVAEEMKDFYRDAFLTNFKKEFKLASIIDEDEVVDPAFPDEEPPNLRALIKDLVQGAAWKLQIVKIDVHEDYKGYDDRENEFTAEYKVQIEALLELRLRQPIPIAKHIAEDLMLCMFGDDPFFGGVRDEAEEFDHGRLHYKQSDYGKETARVEGEQTTHPKIHIAFEVRGYGVEYGPGGY